MSKSILLVDEDPEVLTFLTLLFEEKGVRVLRARSRSEAFEVLRRVYVPIDLVVANIMIDRPGSGFSRQVSQTRPGISVLLMSAFIQDEVIRVEIMRRSDLEGISLPDDRGVLKAVLQTLSRTSTAVS